MRRALVLIISILLATTAFNFPGREKRSFDCHTQDCSFLPLIGNPAPVSVFEIYQYSTRAGTYRFTGDVIAYKPVYDVVVEVRFLDKNGNLQKVSEKVILEATLPGQLNPFDIYTNVEAIEVIPIEASVISWDEESRQIFRNTTIVSVSYEEDTAGTLVTAEVRNDETNSLLNVTGVIWGSFQVFPIEPVDIANVLNPGETETFSKYLAGTPYTTDIHISAQGVLQP